jgi:hypothetical protein
MYSLRQFYLPALAAAAVLVLAMLWHAPAQAVDTQGRYTVKGAGLATCGRFLELAKKGGREFYMFAGFVHGYLSAANALNKQTYDLVPWQSNKVLINSIAKVCAKHKDRRFGEILRRLVLSLAPQRLTEYSDLLKVPGDGVAPVYREVVFRMQTQLQARGHYTGEPTSQYDEATVAAMKLFQAQAQLPVTGHADQATIQRLFYPRKAAAPAAQPTAKK